MPPLTAIERFFERLFERPTARLFHTHVQPVQIQRRIERAMEAGRRPSATRTMVPNRFVVRLNPADLSAFGEGADSLASALADEALSFARGRRYSLVDRPGIDLVADPSVQPADIQVDGTIVARGADAGSRGDNPDGRSATPDPSDTAVFQVPAVGVPHAILRIKEPGREARSMDVNGTELTIGRADDNRLAIRDPGVSRHHGRIVGRRGTLVYADLGSTNGSRVNGERIDEVVLGVGDRLEIGETTMLLEVAEDEP
jgi:hypothetical protein